MKKTNIIIAVASVVAVTGVAYGVLNFNTSVGQVQESQVQTKGDFEKLSSSENAGELQKLKLGNTMQEVKDLLGVEASRSEEILNSEDYDYYEHYELENGDVYDIYYKDGALVGATDFE